MMKRFSILLLLFLLTFSTNAQQRKTTARKPTTAQKRTTTQRKPVAKSQKKTTTKKKTTGTQKQSSGPKTPSYSTAEIKGLEKQRNQIQRNIKEQQQKLSANKADVQKRLEAERRRQADGQKRTKGALHP